MRCASLIALKQIKDVDTDIAKRVREVWRNMTREQLVESFPCCADYVRQCHHEPGIRVLCRMAINNLLGTDGVEHLGQSRHTRNHVYYCNAGDTYAVTVLFNGNTLSVGCWGDLVEHGAIIENQDNWK